MSQLSDHSINKLCQALDWWGRARQPMIWPYVDHKVIHRCGMSYGLSSASYDLRIKHDVRLEPNPIWSLKEELIRRPGFDQNADDFNLRVWLRHLKTTKCNSQLAHTLEYLTIPPNVVGYVVDKSSYARVFVSAMNTLFDPGFRGHAVLELVNLSDEPVVIREGEPVCQMAFHWLDRAARKPYAGKYQNQSAGNHGARLERSDGSWVQR